VKKFIAHGIALSLVALTAACSRQDTTNITTENTFVSDETSDSNLAASDAPLEGNFSDNAALPADGNAQ